MWPRYVDTFGTIMKNIESHKDLIDRQLNIFTIRECVRIREANVAILDGLQKAQLERERLRLKEYLVPFDYDKRLQNVRERFCEGTGTWVLKNPLFQKWLCTGERDLKQRLFWLVGIPGAGGYSKTRFNIY